MAAPSIRSCESVGNVREAIGKANHAQSLNFTRGPISHLAGVFLLTRPPLLAVRPLIRKRSIFAQRNAAKLGTVSKGYHRGQNVGPGQLRFAAPLHDHPQHCKCVCGYRQLNLASRR